MINGNTAFPKKWTFNFGRFSLGSHFILFILTLIAVPVLISIWRSGQEVSKIDSSQAQIPGCPPALDFAAIKTQLNQQGKDLAFVKIGFHAGPGGNHTGLGEWIRCLDAARVPLFLKSVDSAGPIFEAVQRKAVSGVPHTLVYRKCCGAYELPNYSATPIDAARSHWQLHRSVFPPELLPYKHLIWIENINEPDKNRAEWLAEFSYHTAELAMADGFNYAALSWSSGEPEPSHWQGPWMRQFLTLAANNPTRVAIALHEYEYFSEDLNHSYPWLVGRFTKLYEVTSAMGLPKPTVLVTEFGWPGGAPSIDKVMMEDFPWAAQMYAQYPEVKGTAIWYLGSGGPPNTWELFAPMTRYSLQNYFEIPLTGVPPTPPSGSPPPVNQSVVKIYAAGQPAADVYPTIDLTINDQLVQTFTDVRGDNGGGSFIELSYTHPARVFASQVKVKFVNDYYVVGVGDRNLRVDRVNIDGVDYQSEAPTTYSTGTWAFGTGCAPGFKRSEFLHCTGYFAYDQTPNPSPSPAVGIIVRGVHARADGGPLMDADRQAIIDSKVTGVKLMTNHAREYHAQLKALGIKPENIIKRLFLDIGGIQAKPTPEWFADIMRLPIAESMAEGITWFELLNEVNHPSEWRSEWGGAGEFCEWAKQVTTLLRAQHTGVKIISPGLSPATNTLDWIQTFQSCGLFEAVDAVGAHAYWYNRTSMDEEANGRFYRKYFPYLPQGKKIWITEFSNNQGLDSDKDKGFQYVDYWNSLATEADKVYGAYAFVLSASDPFYNNRRETWVRNNASTDIVRAVGGQIPR